MQYLQNKNACFLNYIVIWQVEVYRTVIVCHQNISYRGKQFLLILTKIPLYEKQIFCFTDKCGHTGL